LANLRDIKRRITSVKSTQQITKAMKMVAAAKLRKAQGKLLDARPYAEGMNTILGHLAARETDIKHPLLEVREVKKICYLVLSSDRGLCGSFNANVQRMAKEQIDAYDDDVAVQLINFGRKGFEFFSRREYDIREKYQNVLNDLNFSHAQDVSRLIRKDYENKDFDQIFIVYNSFKSAGSQVVLIDQLLPVKPDDTVGKNKGYESAGYLYEPSAQEILDEIIPKNLTIQIWRALLESVTAEQAARMIAMDAATENAQEMIFNLTLHYNKARQAAITTEISEIVGGAEALKG